MLTLPSFQVQAVQAAIEELSYNSAFFSNKSAWGASCRANPTIVVLQSVLPAEEGKAERVHLKERQKRTFTGSICISR